jgi:WD40 repeat protein
VSRLFISHSSKDSVAAIAFKQWLGENGWPKDDVFLDLEDIGAGEIWKEALRKAHTRCEAVILLASPDALDSPECLTEVRKAEDFGKEIIVVLLRDLTIDDRRLQSYRDRQIVDLSAPPQTHTETVAFRGAQSEVHFNNDALVRVKDYLFRRGITPDSFPWPSEGKPDAEPFPGLSAFTEDDAGIFFGRETDILAGLDEFRLLRRNGSPRILAIQAASGAGKSSFLRAGLWPRLCRDSDYAPLAVVRPAGGILTGPEGLGRKLAPRLSRPGAPVNPGDIYTRLLADDAAKTVAEFAKLMTAAAAQANEERRIVNPSAPPPALIIAIDQAEELLAPEDADESRRFLALLAGLMREPPQGVEPFALLTVRADSATRVLQTIVDQKLEAPKTLTLLPLPQTSYRDVILKPIQVIAQRGQRITLSPALADRLVADATGADALPLLAFTLSYLYQGFAAGGSITLENYEAVGGVAGSIDKAIKQALARPGDAPAIPSAKDEQLACLRATFIPWLARIVPETGQAMRRVAKLDEFQGASRAMVERLVKARLLVADQRDGVDVFEVAHESLLRQWPQLTAWLQADIDDLKVVDGVERAAKEWVDNGKLAAWLDHRGERLSAAEKAAKREDFRRRLGDQGIAYIKACRARENAQRRILRAIVGSVAAAAVLAVLAFYEWRDMLRSQRESAASLQIAESGAYLSNADIANAADRAERAYKSVPSVASRSALLQAAMEISPNAAAAVPLGNDTAEALAWTSGDVLDFATTAGHLRTFDASAAVQAAQGLDLPVIPRPQDGNPSLARNLAPLDGARMIVVFDQGSIGVYQSGKNTVLQQAPQQDISVGSMQHSVAVSHSGALIALATADETIITYHCDWSAPAPSPPACQSALLGDAHGRAVAISPDEKRIAVGDRTGKVTIYDTAGNAIGDAVSFGASINALDWAQQRDWLAVGTLQGEIAVVDVDRKSIVQRQTFGAQQSITALAWSSKELSLAFVCNSTAVCLWRAAADASPANPFKPAIRFEGHRQLITRLSFAPSGTRLASSAADNTIRIWNLTQNTDATFEFYVGSGADINQIAVSPDQKWIAGGGFDGTIEVWDAKIGTSGRLTKSAGNFAIQDLAWNQANVVAAIDDNNTVNVLSADASQAPINIPIKTSAGQNVAWADGDRRIAVPMNENGVILLDPQSPTSEPVSFGAGNKQAWGVASIPGSQLLLVSYVGGEIEIWDLASKKSIGSMSNPQTAPGNRIGVGSLSISPDKHLLATQSGDSTVPIYDIGKRAIWQALETQSPHILAVAFSPDGHKLAALGDDNRLYVWTIGENAAALQFAVTVVTRRGIIDDAAKRRDHATWLDWIADDRIAIATNIAAISIVCIDPDKWLKRIDSLAVAPTASIH